MFVKPFVYNKLIFFVFLFIIIIMLIIISFCHFFMFSLKKCVVYKLIANQYQLWIFLFIFYSLYHFVKELNKYKNKNDGAECDCVTVVYVLMWRRIHVALINLNHRKRWGNIYISSIAIVIAIIIISITITITITQHSISSLFTIQHLPIHYIIHYIILTLRIYVERSFPSSFSFLYKFFTCMTSYQLYENIKYQNLSSTLEDWIAICEWVCVLVCVHN